MTKTTPMELFQQYARFAYEYCINTNAYTRKVLELHNGKILQTNKHNLKLICHIVQDRLKITYLDVVLYYYFLI